MSRLGWFLTILLVTGLMVAAPIYALYRRDLDAARERVEAGGSFEETACGAIEYAIFGTGPPVLMVHGAGGGYDQGLYFASLIGDEFAWIVPSRFGYLGAPLPEDPTVEGQADAHAACSTLSGSVALGSSASLPEGRPPCSSRCAIPNAALPW